MSIHLVGGGWSPDDTELYDLFVAEAAVRGAAVGRSVPRIAVLIVVADDSPSAEFRDGYPAMLAAGGRCEALTTIVSAGDEFDTRVLSDVDGLLVAGGLTPAYLDAVAPLIDQVRLLVADGLPYLGFSAGAMIAADRAVLGGWLIGDVPVCPEDAAEDLDEVTLADGLGLVDLAIDVHAAQWGTLTRLIAATEAGLVRGGVAIDENTALVVGEGALAVLGTGSVWRVEPQLDDGGEIVGVSVGTLGVE
ncbi:Type 1 glutamine amidotransferase-like domain-containing protein [Frigoribacterium sp. SL97]|uniref:Type 1 glutamine amidotransferase-like domain-containing protein n=1 Tax=Frigoribacterium sp. SL97 TaxID=2994664 RepID=UPI00226FFC5D|nr:Type 1 glutamine amidotransferase-like domain-containing protein [Frigoribacterium sp. SL97]WAC50812.1 Type 1 glutamine amidotransferase-like domain-containing protein [Frigoribacterium sp. SL97]